MSCFFDLKIPWTYGVYFVYSWNMFFQSKFPWYEIQTFHNATFISCIEEIKLRLTQIDCNPYIYIYTVYIIVSQYNPIKIGLTLSLSEIRFSISICSTCSEWILQCSIFQAGSMVVHGSMGYLRLVSHDLKRWWR